MFILTKQESKTDLTTVVVFDMVEQNWFSEHIKEIVIEYQTKEQIEAIKQTARHYKKRIEEREERYK